jgi:hypothetical protein
MTNSAFGNPLFPIGGTATIAALLSRFNTSLGMTGKWQLLIWPVLRDLIFAEVDSIAAKGPFKPRRQLMNFALFTYISTPWRGRPEGPVC